MSFYSREFDKTPEHAASPSFLLLPPFSPKYLPQRHILDQRQPTSHSCNDRPSCTTMRMNSENYNLIIFSILIF